MSSDMIQSFVKKISSQIKDLQRDSYDKLQTWSEVEETKDYYGIMPPIESYMNLTPGVLELHAWNCFEIGDMVIGRVVSKLERGMIVRLLCFDGGKCQDIEALEIEARCPRSEIPTLNNHEDPLSRFSINDMIRGEVISAHKREQKLTLTLQTSSSISKQGVTLGLISEENLPVSYKRMCSSNESYNKLLHLSTGFYNPNVIDFLKNRLVTGRVSSFVKELRDFTCSPEELAPALRKRQSAKLAKRSVTKGINYYRKGMMLEALQELNHALDIDPVNVDAFIARGALYANKRTFAKAIGDFEKALSIDQGNKNARKYLIEVLIERAKVIEQDVTDLEQIKEAARLYERALVLDPGCQEAKTALGNVEKSEKEYHKRHRGSSTDSASSSDDSRTQKSEKTATIFKVRQLLEHDVGGDKKRKRSLSESKNSRRRSTSFNSSSSSQSSSSSSSSSSDSSASSSKRRKTSSNHRKLSESEKSKRLSRNTSTSSMEDSRNRRKNSTTVERRRRSGHERQENDDNSRSVSSDSRKRRRSSDKSRDHKPAYKGDYGRDLQSYQSRRPFNDFDRSTGYHDRRSSQHSYESEKYRRKSFPEKSNRRDNQRRTSTGRSDANDDGKPPLSKPITKITKDNFSNLLDQISKFEKQKSSK